MIASMERERIEGHRGGAAHHEPIEREHVIPGAKPTLPQAVRESVCSARECRSQRKDKVAPTRAHKDGGCQSAALRDCHHKPASPCHTAARREDGVCKSGCRRARPRFGKTETPGRRTTPMQRHRVLPRSPPVPRGSRPKMKIKKFSQACRQWQEQAPQDPKHPSTALSPKHQSSQINCCLPVRSNCAGQIVENQT